MEDEVSDRQEVEELDSVDVFSLVGNEKRMAILLTLYDGTVDPPSSFSTLYDHVDINDTSQFNYHLGVLTPHFVSRYSDGYDLTSAGRRVARAITAGTYTVNPEIEPFTIDGRCYACDRHSLVASYTDETFSISCLECDEDVLTVRVPPTVVRGRDRDTIAETFEQWSMYQVQQAIDGLCPTCGGPTEPRVAADLTESIEFDVAAAFDCVICGREVITSFGVIASRHPSVQSFFRNRGLSLRDRRMWEIDQFISGEYTDVHDDDPYIVRVSFYADGDACHVDVNDRLEVVRTEIGSLDQYSRS